MKLPMILLLKKHLRPVASLLKRQGENAAVMAPLSGVPALADS